MKKRIYKILIVSFWAILPLLVFAQKADEQEALVQHIEEVLEYVSEETEADVDFGAYLEVLTDLAENPINLNKASFAQLSTLEGIISPTQMNNILIWREQVGNFFIIEELQAVPGFTIEDVKRILPFVAVKGDIEDFRVPLGKLLVGGQHTFFTRFTRVLEDQKGYQTSINSDNPDSIYTVPAKYLGDKNKIFSRYRYKYGQKISYGITAEKDAGEQFFSGINRAGFDFYSAHFYIKDVGRFKHIALGDYELRLGQGLIAWTGLAFGKSSEVMGVMRQAPSPIRPYTSVNEIAFNRGAAVTLGLLDDKLDVTLFASRKKIDAGSLDTLSTAELAENGINVEDLDLEPNEVAVSLNQSGLHRTINEANRKRLITETNAGASVKYNSRAFAIGLNIIATDYSLNVDSNQVLNISSQDLPENIFRFNGTRTANASVDYRYLYKNFHFFGETGVSDNGGVGTVNGVLMSLHPTIDASIVYRNYGRNFWTLKGFAFRESGLYNERGLFFGTVFKPRKGWRVNAYFDIYQFPWLRNNVDAPSRGMDKLIQLTYRPSRALEMYARYRSETKTRNLSGYEGNDILTPHTTEALRFQARYKISKAITMKTRFQISGFDDGFNEKERGFMILQDFNFKPLSFPVSFSTRFALFDTDSYDTRIYAYENDVLYSFSIPAYSYRGSRFYLMMRYKTRFGMDLWLRFAQTYFDNYKDGELLIGSGNEQILGRTRSEIKAQVRFKF